MASLDIQEIWKTLELYNLKINYKSYPHLVCQICQNIFHNAYQSSCGCRYCYLCIKTYLNEGDKNCPLCNEQKINLKNDLHIDNVANKEISRIKVLCPEEFCQHEDELRYLPNHMESHKILCPYNQMGCISPMLGTEAMKDHLSSKSLDHANFLIGFMENMKNEITFINDTVRAMKGNNKMGDNIEQVNITLERHKKEIDDLRKSKTAINVRLDQERKISRETISKLENRVKKLENQNNANKQSQSKPTNKNDGNTKTNSAKKDNDTGSLFSPGPNTGTKQQSQMFPTGILHEQTIPDLNNIVDKWTQGLTVNTDLESSVVTAPYLWEILDFPKKLFESRASQCPFLISNEFTSHPNGYKLRLCLYPHGTGQDKDSFLSVFFHVMRGEFDDLLKWPFPGIVSVDLLDGNGLEPFLGFKFRYDSSASFLKSAFDRPTKSMNVGCGILKFIRSNVVLTTDRVMRKKLIKLKCSVEF